MVDLARKVVGVGSVGTRCWIVLLLGRDGDDPLFLQIKEAQASVLEPYLGKSAYKNHGQRIVAGQRLMQASSDIFLGWLRSKETLDGAERDFYVRQLWDWKTSVDLDTILPEGLALYGGVCGFLLARAHARSGTCPHGGCAPLDPAGGRMRTNALRERLLRVVPVPRLELVRSGRTLAERGEEDAEPVGALRERRSDERQLGEVAAEEDGKRQEGSEGHEPGVAAPAACRLHDLPLAARRRRPAHGASSLARNASRASSTVA